jgi:hypothetical protein
MKSRYGTTPSSSLRAEIMYACMILYYSALKYETAPPNSGEVSVVKVREKS